MNIKLSSILCIVFIIFHWSCKRDSEFEKSLSPLTAKKISLNKLGIAEYPYDDTVKKLIEAPIPKDWKKSGIDKRKYLEMMERIVRMASKWINSEGAVIDPYYHAEFGQTTPRFVSSASVLLHFGRVPELKELVIKSMSYSCSQLANAKGGSPDFWMRELSTAFICLKPMVKKEVWGSWAKQLQSVNPEKVYKDIDSTGQNLDKLNNWAVYSSGGEYMREAVGLTSKSNDFIDGVDFFDKYMNAQLVHFTKEGMYRDPNDPITYDITTRLQIGNALTYGYDGPLRDELSEFLRRGGLTMLLFTSPDGYVPYGGRSGEFQFQEAIIAALSELEANRYKTSNPKLAGIFKRQAHISIQSIKRWALDMEPFRHIKNGFEPKLQHGIDTYGKYSVYSLYYSSVLGLAALYADDEIEEHPTFSETGGYLLELYPAFHKIFASVTNSQIEIDTRGTPHHESVGLGRFQAKGVPLELGMGMPFVFNPKYRMADSLVPSENFAIGPSWVSKGAHFSLANISSHLTHKLERIRESKDNVEFLLEYSINSADTILVQQHYNLLGKKLEIDSKILGIDETPIDNTSFSVPLLVTNGSSKSEILKEDRRIKVNYMGHSLEVELDDQESTYHIAPKLFANRNGIYKNLIIETPGNHIKINLTLK